MGYRTYNDLIRNVDSTVRAWGGKSASQEQIMFAIGRAYRTLPLLSDWAYYHSTARVAINAPQTEGTVTRDGLALTLSGATWPEWCPGCTIDIDGIRARIARVTADSAVAMLDARTPISDAISDATYTLYHDSVEAPGDLRAIATPPARDTGSELVFLDAHVFDELMFAYGTPLAYTLSHHLGNSARLRLHPAPGSADTLVFGYQRWPQALVYSGLAASDTDGTAYADAATQSVLPADAEFSAAWVGAVIRLGTATQVPTGLDGRAPFAAEGLIVEATTDGEGVVDALLLADAVPDVGSEENGVRFMVSSPVDASEAMYHAILALAIAELATMLGVDPAIAAAGLAVSRAMSAEPRSTRMGCYGDGGALLSRTSLAGSGVFRPI